MSTALLSGLIILVLLVIMLIAGVPIAVVEFPPFAQSCLLWIPV